MLIQTGLSTSQAALVPVLDDADIRVALRAWDGVTAYGYNAKENSARPVRAGRKTVRAHAEKQNAKAHCLGLDRERKTSQGSVSAFTAILLGRATRRSGLCPTLEKNGRLGAAANC